MLICGIERRKIDENILVRLVYESIVIPAFLHYFCYFSACVTAYRAVAFTHEIVHQSCNKNFDRRFIWFWNLSAGALALTPSIGFKKHLRHHAIGIFGTKKDAQYPLLRKGGKWQLDKILLLFVLLPLVNPLINLARVMSTPYSYIFPGQNIKSPLLFLFDKNVELSNKEKHILLGLDTYYLAIAIILALSGLFWYWYPIAVGGYFFTRPGCRMAYTHIFVLRCFRTLHLNNS